MKITAKELKSLNPCTDGYNWYLKNGTEDLLETLLKVNKYNSNWARWLFTNLMNRKQCLEIAIYSAELVLPIFEKSYPGDNRPKAAIEAAKAVLKENTKENREKAVNAVNAARYAAYAADVAYYGAYAAKAENNAANAVYHAAYAAYYAANAANVEYCAAKVNKKEIQERIIREAVRILERK